MKVKKSFFEVLRYIIVGGLTTFVNLLVLSLLTSLFGFDYKYICNTIAIVASIIFAFFANRFFVFNSGGPIFKEFIAFFSSRIIISLIFDNGFYWFFSEIVGLNGTIPIIKVEWSKLVGMVFVVVANYLVAKFLVFRSVQTGEKQSK